MKTKTIPFDLETAKKIQAGEIEGTIKTRDSKHKMRIICYDSTAKYLGKTQPIIAQDTDDCCCIYTYFEDGLFIGGVPNIKDLVLEVSDTKSDKPQFKPFDKVIVRRPYKTELCIPEDVWLPGIFQYKSVNTSLYFVSGKAYWDCIPYEGNEHLVGTTDKPKEELV